MWNMFQKCQLIRLIAKPSCDDSKLTQASPKYLLKLYIAFVHTVCVKQQSNSVESILLKVMCESEIDKQLLLEALLQATMFNDPTCELALGAVSVLLAFFQIDVRYFSI